MKAPHLHYSKTEEAIQMMRQVKKLFDPKGIMSTSSLSNPLPSLPRSFCSIPFRKTDFPPPWPTDPYKYLPEEADPTQRP